MTTIHRTAIVPYTTQQMFDLVNRISEYPLFLPWCKSSEVLSQTDQQITASLSVVWSGIRKTFTTQNDLEPYNKIGLKLVEGPFNYLEGYWEFVALSDQGSRVDLKVEMKLKNSFMDRLIQPIIENMANSLVDAFCTRATVVYG